MKQVTIAFLSLAFLLSVKVVKADDPPKTPQTRPAIQAAESGVLSRLRQAAGSLKLNDDQKKKLDAMIDKAGGDLKTAAEKFKDDSQARARDAQDIFDRLRDEMRDVLSTEQRQELQQRLQSLMGGSAGLLELLKEQVQKLDLSDQQKKQIDQIMADARVKFSDLREQARAGSQEAREKILDLYSETLKKMQEVLTPDQKKKLQENISPRREPAKDK